MQTNGNGHPRESSLDDNPDLPPFEAQARAAAMELGGRLQDAIQQGAQLVRERPITSLLIAAGAGYLIGRLLRA